MYLDKELKGSPVGLEEDGLQKGVVYGPAQPRLSDAHLRAYRHLEKVNCKGA